LKGKIIKGIAGFYYVHTPDNDVIYECKAKGIFRNQRIKPLVGDDVEIDTDNQPPGEGTIVDILQRRNELIRPAVANVDQALVLFAAARPAPNLNLLDRFLIMMEKQGLDTIICFNKMDIVSEQEASKLKETYEKCGSSVLYASLLKQEGISELYALMKGKTTVLAGPSGVGKSTLINLLQPGIHMETGAVSEKIERGKHTTRHSELIFVEQDTYVCDTPGFSSLNLIDMKKEELREYFAEFREYEENCRFLSCSHLSEPGCAVKEALKQQKISAVRYENYTLLYEELKNQKRY
jgi:ribosome biogenesis GTPase